MQINNKKQVTNVKKYSGVHTVQNKKRLYTNKTKQLKATAALLFALLIGGGYVTTVNYFQNKSFDENKNPITEQIVKLDNGKTYTVSTYKSGEVYIKLPDGTCVKTVDGLTGQQLIDQTKTDEPIKSGR